MAGAPLMPNPTRMRLSAPDDVTDWQQIESDARHQALEAEGTPLALGASVAWTERRFGRTEDFTLVHRAAQGSAINPDHQDALCGEHIPPAVIRVPLSPNLVRTLGRCRYCDEEYAKTVQKGVAA